MVSKHAVSKHAVSKHAVSEAAASDVAAFDVATSDVAESDVAGSDVAGSEQTVSKLAAMKHAVTTVQAANGGGRDAGGVDANDTSSRILTQHPLRARRRPGPPGADAKPRPDQDLEDAIRVLELIDEGVLPANAPPALPVPVTATGKPRRRLTAEDERALAERIQTWGDVDARNALVLANLGLVHLVANQMRRAGVRYEDLVQEGTLGLLRATETFEPDRNVRFSTYCVYWIRAKIQRYLQRLDRDDTPAIAGAEMETLEGGRRRRPRARSVSIDTPMDEDDDRSMGDVLADAAEDPEDNTLRFERSRAVTEVLDGICAEIGDPRLRTIIEKRLLADEPETLAVLGDRLNLSREGARLLENKVLKLARQRLHEFRDVPQV